MVGDMILRFPANAAGKRQELVHLPVVLEEQRSIEDITRYFWLPVVMLILMGRLVRWPRRSYCTGPRPLVHQWAGSAVVEIVHGARVIVQVSKCVAAVESAA